MIVVSDTSPVSALFRIGQLELLKKVFGKVIIPPAVAGELDNLKHFDFDVSILKNLSWLEIHQVQNPSAVSTFQPLLDPGESEAIVLAKELQADFILMDEKEGRLVAARE